MHLTRVRPKRRKLKAANKADRVLQVFTLCGEWVAKREAVRLDRLRWLPACDECKAVTS